MFPEAGVGIFLRRKRYFQVRTVTFGLRDARRNAAHPRLVPVLSVDKVVRAVFRICRRIEPFSEPRRYLLQHRSLLPLDRVPIRVKLGQVPPVKILRRLLRRFGLSRGAEAEGKSKESNW